MSTLLESYNKEGIKKLQDELKIVNRMAVPKLIKIVVNTGLGEALADKKVIQTMSDQLGQITGQKAQFRAAHKDISAFKLRKGDVIGLKITLRGERMYTFFEKMVRIVLPRIRDFRGVSVRGFDGKGNYSIGLKEQIVFPEIDYGQIDKIRGLQITFVTSAKDKKGTQALLTFFGMPFEKIKKEKTASAPRK
jgi:large subunit ribosomal protein L5